MIFFLKKNKGFTLIEAVISIAIFSVVVVVIGSFQRDVFFFNDILQTGLTNITEARKVLRPFVHEVRAAQPSNLGAFAITEANSTSFAFYSDIDNDGVRERVRYFLDGNTFKKGIIEPDEDTFVYNEEDEEIIKVVNDVVESETTFSYFDSNYNTTETPTDVRLVRIDLTIDSNPDRAPSLLTITTQATIRNLKDNYED